MARTREELNLRVIEALYAATGAGDWPTAESMLTEDFFITEADTVPFAGVYRGRKALHDLYMRVIPATGVTGLHIQQLTAGGDCVIALVQLTLGGSPGTDVSIAELFRLRDGKVCEIKPYYFDPTPICAAVAARTQG